jgi:hypothetical protein
MLRFCFVVLAVGILGGCQSQPTSGSSSTTGQTVVIGGDSVMIGHGDSVMIGHGDTVMVGHGDSVMIGHGDSVKRNGVWMRRCRFEIEWWQPFGAHKTKVVALRCPRA